MAIKLEFSFTQKQKEALQKYFDNKTVEVLFGGGAGGGKSYLWASAFIIKGLKYKGLRFLVGRKEYVDLRDSTMNTFFSVLGSKGLKKGVHYSFNGETKVLTLTQTGSEYYFRYLKDEPSDPDFNRLGSTEYTDAFIDEAQEVSEKAKNIVLTRLRYMHDVYGLIAKLVMGCNPHKGWLKREFYDPYTDGTLDDDKAFIPALAKDNSYIGSGYVKMLERIPDRALKERQLMGNWNYDNDPTLLVEYKRINDIFSNSHIEEREDRYITVDASRKGKDKMTAYVWAGWKCIRVEYWSGLKLLSTGDEDSSEMRIRRLKDQYAVPMHNIIIDEVGVGGGLVDRLGCVGFIANATPQLNAQGEKENYKSLKDQCGYRLADKVNTGGLWVDTTDSDLKASITEELSVLKSAGKEDEKLRIIDKDTQKKLIGHSPDHLDNLIIRCYFKDEDADTMFAVWL